MNAYRFLTGAFSPTRVGLLVHWLAAVSSAALVLMMTLTFVAVFTRYVLNIPILGINEVIQLLSVTLVFMAMPYATLKDAHIRVDILDKTIGQIGCLIGDVLAGTLTTAVLIILVHRTWLKMLDAMEYEDATNMLGLPMWPCFALIVAGMGLYALVITRRTLDLFPRQEARHE